MTVSGGSPIGQHKLEVGYTIHNSGGGNPAESHKVKIVADWQRMVDVEVEKELLGGGDTINSDEEVTFVITLTNHGQASSSILNLFDRLAGPDPSKKDPGPLRFQGAEQVSGPKPTQPLGGGFLGAQFHGAWKLKPGEKVVVHIRAKAVSDGVGTNTAGLFAYNFESNRVDPKPENDSKRLRYRVRPAPDSSVASAGPTGVAGSASTAAQAARGQAGTPFARRATARAGTGVKRVDVAILRIGKGLKALDGQLPAVQSHKPGKCEWLSGKGGGFAKRKPTKGVCDSPVWVRAAGTKHWSLSLKHRLPEGRYVLYSRATDSKGVSESNFTAKDGNRRTFRVK